MIKEYDIVVVGAGLAGLYFTKLLSEKNFRILLIDRKSDLNLVHTTGIFVRKTLEDFNIPLNCLGPVVNNVKLYSPNKKFIHLKSNNDEFRIGKMDKLYNKLLQNCLHNGAHISLGTNYISSKPHKDKENESLVTLKSKDNLWQVSTNILVGADGTISNVAKDLNLDLNNEWIVGFEEVYTAQKTDKPCFHCFLDPKNAPGYLAWVVNDGEEIHIGVGGYISKFNPKQSLENFKKSAIDIVDLSRSQIVETRGGRIPVGGILNNISNTRGILIGDASGAPSPLTAGGLDPCLRLSSLAAYLIEQYINTSDHKNLEFYSGKFFRTRFISRLWMRRIFSKVQNPSIINLSCLILNLPIINNLAWHIFFGRSSFPDINTVLEVRHNLLNNS